MQWFHCRRTGELQDSCRCPVCGMALLPFGDEGWFHPPVPPTSQQILQALEEFSKRLERRRGPRWERLVREEDLN